MHENITDITWHTKLYCAPFRSFCSPYTIYAILCLSSFFLGGVHQIKNTTQTTTDFYAKMFKNTFPWSMCLLGSKSLITKFIPFGIEKLLCSWWYTLLQNNQYISNHTLKTYLHYALLQGCSYWMTMSLCLILQRSVQGLPCGWKKIGQVTNKYLP